MKPEELLRGLKATGAPADLRARVLDAARAAALAPEEPPRSWVDRLWESRALRLGGLAAAAGLIAAHLALSRPAPSVPAREAAAEPAFAPPDWTGRSPESWAMALPEPEPVSRHFEPAVMGEL